MDSDLPSNLARFPQNVRDAYRRHVATGAVEAVDVVVLAALRDFAPKKEEINLADNMRLIEDLGYDSLAVAEMVFFIEDLFHVRIETKEIMEIRTVHELRAFVTLKLGRKKETDF